LKPEVQQTVKFPILTYHSIDAGGSVISTAPETFRRQMIFLRDEGWRVVALEKLIEDFDAGKMLPAKTAALTFDDGFQNFYDDAFPILNEFGFGATVFLVTDFCGKSNDWSGNPKDLPRLKLLEWDRIRELSRHDIEFGAHTCTHPDLTQLSARQSVAEIVDSKNTIEDAIGKPVKSFAYPYGKFDERIKQCAAQNFRAACSVRLGRVNDTSDRSALARVDAFYLQNPFFFRAFSFSAFDRYLTFRQVLRDFKSVFQFDSPKSIKRSGTETPPGI
jgi:peptidoglycan/xylan/chitin deacetylase (PgdA/CDA1 family)